jgi:hypothetical protein
LEILRRVVKNAADSNSDSERRIAMILANKIDDFVLNLSPTQVTSGNAQMASSAINRARDLWTKASKSEDIGRLIERAKIRAPNFSASGLENSLRVEFIDVAGVGDHRRVAAQGFELGGHGG